MVVLVLTILFRQLGRCSNGGISMVIAERTIAMVIGCPMIGWVVMSRCFSRTWLWLWLW